MYGLCDVIWILIGLRSEYKIRFMRKLRNFGYEYETQNAVERSFCGNTRVSLCGTSAVRGSKRNASAGSNGTSTK